MGFFLEASEPNGLPPSGVRLLFESDEKVEDNRLRVLLTIDNQQIIAVGLLI